MAKFEGYKDIYVFVEQKNGEVANVGYELISEARKLVASIPQMNFQVVGVLLGHNIKDKANDVIAHGADKVIVVDDALLEGYSTQFYADALTQVINSFKPDSFLTGATVLGRDLAPRVAARLNAGLTADATKIEIDQEKAKDGEALLLVTRPTFGGKPVWYDRMSGYSSADGNNSSERILYGCSGCFQNRRGCRIYSGMDRYRSKVIVKK